MKTLLVALALAACQNGGTPAPATTKQARPEAPPPPAPGTPGTMHEKKFASAALGVEKAYRLYLPAGYESSTTRYPVFYYLHGLGGNEDNWVDGGDIGKAADAMGLQAILVMVDGDDGFYVNGVAPVDYDKCIAEGTGLLMPTRGLRQTTCVRKRDYDTYITKDLIAHIDSTYRTIATREARGIAGLSMGGFGALQLSMRHQDLFAAAASHSGLVSLLFNGPIPYKRETVQLLTDVNTWAGPLVEIRNWVLGLFGNDIARWRELDPTTLVSKLEPGRLALYVDCGTEDEFMFHNHNAYLHDLLTERKIEHEYYLGPGRHNFGFWSARVPHSLRFLRDHTTKP